MQIRKQCSLTFLLLLSLTQVACASDDYAVTEVTDGIYYHQGVHQDATEENIGAIANVGFIIGDDCVAVIDSGGSFEEGRLLKQALLKQTDKPVCYVINTHVHPDHILGNAVFKDSTPIYIGHEKLPAALASRKSFFERVFSDALGDAYTGAEFIAPEQTVSVGEPVIIDLGNRQLTLTAFTTAHTDHDLTVLDQTTQTLWTGDLLFIERTPALDGSINGWINAIEQLQQQDVRFVVPGHGPASETAWQSALQKQLDYFITMREQIRTIINDFGTIDQATKTVGQKQNGEWLLFEEYHRRNVTSAFVELEWE